MRSRTGAGLYCLALYNPATDTAKSVDFIKWMYSTRSHLDEVYDLKDGYVVTNNYLHKAKATVTRQLLPGGLRLAAVVEKLFYASTPVIDFKEATRSAKRGIDIKEAANNIGKQVTICEHIYSIKDRQRVAGGQDWEVNCMKTLK